MSDMNDPIFRRNYAQAQAAKAKQQQQLREFTVGEEDENYYTPEPDSMVTPPQYQQSYKPSPAELERLAKTRKEQSAGIFRVSEQAKKRIEILANLGRLNKDVDIEGIIFSLRTLKAKETKDASLAILNCNTQLEAGFESRRQQLARSLFKIDNQSINLVLGDDSLNTKLQFIDELEESVLSKLFDEFTVLKNEIKKKYDMKTDEEVKEVVEDIKK